MKTKFNNTLGDLQKDFLTSEQETCCRPDRYSHKKSNSEKFVEFIGRDIPVYQVTEDDAREFCERVAGKHTPSTYMQIIRDCVAMFKYAVRHRYIVDSPMTTDLMNNTYDQMYAPVSNGRNEILNKKLTELVKDAISSNNALVCKLMDLMEPVEVVS